MGSEFVDMVLAGPLSIAPFSWQAVFACVLAGGIVGFERHKHGKPIGMRTNILICLGTYVFARAGLAIATELSDPTRIIGQIVAGIGFLGAGVILRRDGVVVGVTTAASIWMLAGIGVVIATQPPALGVKLAILCVFILLCAGVVEHGLERGGQKLNPLDKPSAETLSDGTLDVEPLDVVDPSGSKQSQLAEHEHE